MPSEYGGFGSASTRSRLRLVPGPVGPPGPPGPTGPPGLAGDEALFYLHTQVTTLASWVINHDLGYGPNVSVTGSDGNILVGNVVHHSVNQLEIQFNTPQTGTARLT